MQLNNSLIYANLSSHKLGLIPPT